MEWIQLLIGTVVGGVLLFIWSGITNNLPWGIGSIANIEQAPELGEAVQKQLDLGNRALFLSDVVAAFVVARPKSYYSIPRYFALEFATQLAVAFLLSLIIGLTDALTSETQLSLIVLIGLIASFGTLFQYWNWWGFPARLALGSSLNLVIGWTVVGFILMRFIIV
ncbi:MAG: hypothetical protein RLP44_10575 [Aggregatilineales bacterium]